MSMFEMGRQRIRQPKDPYAVPSSALVKAQQAANTRPQTQPTYANQQGGFVHGMLPRPEGKPDVRSDIMKSMRGSPFGMNMGVQGPRRP